MSSITVFLKLLALVCVSSIGSIRGIPESVSSVAVTHYQRVPASVYEDFYKNYGSTTWLQSNKVRKNSVPVAHFTYQIRHPTGTRPKPTVTIPDSDTEEFDIRFQPPWFWNPASGNDPNTAWSTKIENKKTNFIAFPTKPEVALGNRREESTTSADLVFATSTTPPVRIPPPAKFRPAHFDSSPIVFPEETDFAHDRIKPRPTPQITTTTEAPTTTQNAESQEHLENESLAKEFLNWIKESGALEKGRSQADSLLRSSGGRLNGIKQLLFPATTTR